MRVAVRLEPDKTGLALVFQSQRASIVRVDGKRVGRVGFARSLSDPNWYWYAGDETLGIRCRNSAAEGVTYPTKEEARDVCVAYVKDCLAKAKAG